MPDVFSGTLLTCSPSVTTDIKGNHSLSTTKSKIHPINRNKSELERNYREESNL